MGNIYIETDEDFRVTKIHRMPFDPVNGMGYTREELEKKGFFVDEIPEPVHQVGRRSIAMYNPDTKSIYYESVGVPLSDKERVEYMENAFNALLESVYSQNSSASMFNMPAVATLSLEEETKTDEENQVSDSGTDAIATYLAYQIISGKMDANDCFNKYPQCRDTIVEVLSNNGIQA